MNILRQIITIAFLSFTFLFNMANAEWQNLGGSKRPWVGRGVDMSIGGSGNEKRIFIADDYHYLYRSEDSGLNWSILRNPLEEATWRPTVVECWPPDPDTIYICRYHEDYVPWASYDGGLDWIDVGTGYSFVNPQAHTFFVNPEDDSAKGCQVWAGCNKYTSGSGAEPTLLRRRNCTGDTEWDHFPDEDGDRLYAGPVYDFAYDPDSVELYIAVGYRESDSANGCVGYLDASVWEQSEHHDLDFSAILNDVDCRCLGIDPDNHDYIYASDWRTTDGGLHWSSDGGTNWNQLENAPDSIYDILVVEEGGNGPCDTIFVATKSNGVYRSTNQGSSWSQYNTGIKCKELYRIDMDEDHNIYTSGKWSVYKILSSGSSWTECTKGMRVPLVNGLMVDFPNIYCASDFDFIHFSSNAGTDWNTQYSFDSDTLYDNSVKTILPFDVERNGSSSRLLYTAVDVPSDGRADFIKKSTDFGTTWSNSYYPHYNSDGKHCNDIAINQDSPSTTYAAFDYSTFYSFMMIKTTNSGVNWSAIVANLPNDDVLDIALYPGAQNDILYINTKTNGVYRSGDGGSSWSAKGLSGKTLYDIAVDPDDSSIVYAAASDGVWKTTNSGTDWNLANNGMSGKQIIELEIHPIKTSIVFAVAKDDSGHYVYLTPDAGDDWTNISYDLPNEFILT